MYRVLHSVSYLRRAGVETMLMNYYKHMDRTLIQFDFLVNANKKGSYEEEVSNLGARIFRTPGYNPFKYFKYRNGMKELFNAHPEIKIIHGHNGALSYFPLAAAKRASVPIRVAHSHNTKIDFDYKWIIKQFCRFKLRRAANYYFACSDLAAKFYFGSKAVQGKNYFLIRNAIELEKFSYDRQVRECLRKSKGWEKKIIVGHVGRFMHQKNHEFLIDIFYHIRKIRPEAVLVLIGDGNLENRTRNKVASLGMNDVVNFIGSIANVNEYYQAMDILLMPSWNEGLPVVGIEAQASGLPCVFSNKITTEVKVTKNAYFYPLEESSKQWAAYALEKINNYSRKNVKKEMTDSGYNIKVEAKRLEKIYLNLLNQESPKYRQL